MPRLASILLKGNSKRLTKHGCCQFLHTTSDHYTGLIPLKYLFNHKDISKKFEDWMRFLNDDLDLRINFKIEDREVWGWRSLKQANQVFEANKKEYFLATPQTRTHFGVYERTSRAIMQIIDTDKLFIANYAGGNLLASARKGCDVPKSLYLKEDIPKFTIPVALVELPTGLAPEHNSFKYIAWFLVRHYVTYQHICNFILSNRKGLEKIMKEHDLSWWNIVFAMMHIFPISTFGCHTYKKLSREDIENAFENAVKDIEENNDEYFEYQEHEIHVQGAMERYCGIDKDVLYGAPRFSSILAPFKDSPSGELTSAEYATILEKFNSYFKYIKK